MKEIIFYTMGDSLNVSTWSNVPYLFSTHLEKKNIIVRRINLKPNKYLSGFWNKIITRIINPFYPGHVYTFDRTLLFQYLVDLKIKQSIKKYPKADYCIFTCFNFYNKYNKIPSLLFSDWTYDILIRDRLKRELYWFEKRHSKQEETAINSAKIVVSLFPVCADLMKQQYPQANINYLGGNVINSLYNKELNENTILESKSKSNILLFIGGPKYLNGAKLLIEALKIINQDKQYELHLIGLTKSTFDKLPPYVFCHGYLRKDNPQERDLYYRLLITAKILINPTPLWGGYSSTIESMFFYTPVIVSPYKDFVDEFGKEIDFGLYNNEFSADALASNINSILQDQEYLSRCKNAHNRVKDYTWDNYISKLLKLMSNPV